MFLSSFSSDSAAQNKALFKNFAFKLLVINALISIITSIILSAALTVGRPVEEHRNNVELNIDETPVVVEYDDPHCRTPYMTPDEVAQIIRDTQTMDLNFVYLADGESGLNNTSYHSVYRGIFHIHEGYHVGIGEGKIDDFCNPAEQVEWLEYKLENGADPARLFPALHGRLYE